MSSSSDMEDHDQPWTKVARGRGPGRGGSGAGRGHHIPGGLGLLQRWKKYFSFSVSYIDQKLSQKKKSIFIFKYLYCL